MKLVNNSSKQNKDRARRFYGNEDKPYENKSVLSVPRENGFPLRLGMKTVKLELSKTESGGDLLVKTHTLNQETETMAKVLVGIRDQEEFENDEKLLTTFELVCAKKDIKRINLEHFLEEVKESFGDDIRYAFKEITTQASKNMRHSVYIYHIYVIIIATMSIINELDFKPPVHIELIKNDNNVKLSFRIKSKRLGEVINKRRLLNIPGIEIRLEYIGALCQEDDINNTFKIIDNTLLIDYAFGELAYKEGALFSNAREEKSFFKEYMDIFN